MCVCVCPLKITGIRLACVPSFSFSRGTQHFTGTVSNEATSPEALLMRFCFSGSRPLHLGPLSSFPLHTLLFPLFFHVLLSSCFVISSFPLFARASVLALVCTCSSTTQFLGRPGLDNEVRLIGCPCAFGFSFIATTHTFAPSRPPSHVFILFVFPARAFAHSS